MGPLGFKRVQLQTLNRNAEGKIASLSVLGKLITFKGCNEA